MSTPTKVPAIEPLPPMRLVPPITTAAMASSSMPTPASGFTLTVLRRVQDAGEAREEARQGIDRDLDPVDRHTR